MEPIPETVRAAEELGPFAQFDDPLGDLLEGLVDTGDRVVELVPTTVALSVISQEHGVTLTAVVAGQGAGTGLDHEATSRIAASVESSAQFPIVRHGRRTASVVLYAVRRDAFAGRTAAIAAVLGAVDDVVLDADLSFTSRFAAESAPERLLHEDVLGESVTLLESEGRDRLEARALLHESARRAGITELQLAEALVHLHRAG